MKLRRKYAFIVFKIHNDQIVADTIKTIEDATAIGSEATFEEFISKMPATRAATAGADGIRNKLVFFLWAPDTAKIRSRMIYASSKLAIRQRLDGIHAEIQCTDPAELAHEAVFEKLAPKGATPVVRPPKA
ncbi:hypothetical protein DFJ73DRAFT_954538 [Zopfochytrium polystomum]|nr:hypothetical protein DFJ73DRAFT_954538 [Zopfochytrium polystomum]